MASACQSYQRLLSAFADGEVTARERSQVETHLTGCADCRGRLDDLRAVGQAVQARIQQQVEQADFSGFADEVFRRIGPERPGLFERLRVGWQEILEYHRTAVISSFATAAVTLVVAVPLVYQFAAQRAASPEIVLHDLKLTDPDVQPVVMNMGEGKTLIMLVRKPGTTEDSAPVDLDAQQPTGGDL